MVNSDNDFSSTFSQNFGYSIKNEREGTDASWS